MALSHVAAVVGSAAREEVSKLLATERAERKRAAAALSHHAARIKGARSRTPADKQAVMSDALSIPHPVRFNSILIRFNSTLIRH